MSAIGTAIGPALGGLLLGFGGWRAVFLILVPVGAAAILAGYRHLPRATVDNRGPGTGFDKLGALLLTASVSAFALSVTLGGGSIGPGNLALLIAAASGFALFGFVEARASTPLVRLAYLRDKVLSAALAANLVVSAVMMSTLVVGPFYLASVIGLGSLGIGLAMSAGPSLVAILGFPAGQIADRFGGERTSLAGLAVMAAGSLTLVLAPVSSGLAGYLIPVAVITIGYALFQTSNNMIVMLRAARAESGAVAGLLNLSRNLGLISGAAVMGTVFARASGAAELSHALPEAISAGMRTSFTVAGVLVGAAFVLTVLVGRRGTEAVGLG
jgi:MFS family permease